ncbi:hypothetical protein ADUPG1_001671, partial [Aduncisulcus paluster]
VKDLPFLPKPDGLSTFNLFCHQPKDILHTAHLRQGERVVILLEKLLGDKSLCDLGKQIHSLKPIVTMKEVRIRGNWSGDDYGKFLLNMPLIIGTIAAASHNRPLMKVGLLSSLIELGLRKRDIELDDMQLIQRAIVWRNDEMAKNGVRWTILMYEQEQIVTQFKRMGPLHHFDTQIMERLHKTAKHVSSRRNNW